VTKVLIGFVVLCAIAAIGVGVYVVFDNRDPVPNDVQACIRKQGLTLARSTQALALVRVDASAGDLKVRRRWDWGHTKGVLLAGPQGDYSLLALWNSGTPSLARGDVGRRVYDSPGRFPAVALETPDRKVLLACANGIDT
jgi:hypothetical protein